MTVPTLRAAFSAPAALPTGWLTLPDPILAETMVSAGFRALVIDMQHGMITPRDALAIVAAIRARGGYALARVPVGGFETASRLLDWGAEAVVAPMIETAAEARAFAAFAKYPPLGSRSWGPTRALQLNGASAEAYRLAANDDTLALVMIETRPALANLDAILAVPGIDGVFLGPADLSIALSDGDSLDVDRSDNLAAIEKVALKTRAVGKIAGIYAASPAHARRYRAMGYHFANVSQDVALMIDAVRTAVAASGD
jgi:4-hydroxy-2-oxoheptanedioate aldolase